jgi:hypothetical protein
MKRLAGVPVGLCVVAGIAAGSADARSIGTIEAPRASALARGPATAVVVRTAPGVRLVRADLDGRALTLQRRGRTFRARVTRRRAGPGMHHLRVTLRRGERRAMLQRRFAVAGRRARLVRVDAPARARRAPVHVRVRQNRDELLERLRVRLNGRTITSHFVNTSGFAERDRLSARHGLRRGVNRLEVLAIGPRGRWDRERRRIVLRRGVPIPDAGPDRRLVAGRAVRLGNTGPQHRWRLVARPRGSRARLRRGRLVTDEPGRYRVTHVRRRGGRRSGADLMEVRAVPDIPPLGVPIDTMASQDGTTGIQLGDDFYARDAGTMQVLTIDRATTDVTNTTSYPATGDGMSQLTGALDGLTSGTMVVIAADANQFQGGQSGLDAIGGPSTTYFGGGGFSVIGVRGIPAGEAWTNVESRSLDGALGALEGHLTLDTAAPPNYQFQPDDVLPFDTNTTSAGEGATSVTATIAGQSYSGSVPSGSAGFLVVTVDAGTLQLIDSQTFATTNSGNDASNQQAMAGHLSNWAGQPWVLVLVQSIGHVKPTAWEWDEIGAQLDAHGGTADVFNRVDGGYSFVGGAGLGYAEGAETSTTLNPLASGPVGTRLQGVLERGRSFQLQPTLHGPMTAAGNFPDFEMAVIAYQPETPWPNGTSGDTGAANAYIAQKIGVPPGPDGTYDVRSLYTDTGYNWDVLSQGFSCPNPPDPGLGFTYQECNDMLNQFHDEYEDLQQVQKYLGTDGLLAAPITDAQGTDSILLNGVAKSIHDAVNPPDSGLTVDWETIVEEVIDDVAVVVGFVPGGEAAAGVLGVVASGFGIAGSFSKNSDGSLSSQLKTDTEALAADADASFTQTIDGLGRLYALVATDSGKLQSFATQSSGTNPAWDLGPQNDSIRWAWEFAAKQGFYASLLGVAYYTVRVPATYCLSWGGSGPPNGCDAPPPVRTYDAAEFNCYVADGVYFNSKPFSDTPADDSGQFKAVTSLHDDLSWIFTIDVMIESGTKWTMPDEELMDPVFAMPQSETDLNAGFAPVELYPKAFPTPWSMGDWENEYGGCETYD